MLMTSRPGSSQFQPKSSLVSSVTFFLVSQNSMALIKMKTFFILLSLASLGIHPSFCERRIRRQIWPQPPHPNHWPGFNGPIGFGSGGEGPNPWMRPGFEPPFNNALDDGQFTGGQNNNRRNQNNNFRNDPIRFEDDNDDDRRNQNGRDESGWSQNERDNRDRNQNGRGDSGRNQNRRTTTTLGPITPTPRTIHTSPQGCSCPSTPQFNPVCGTDGNTYRNAGLLKCYQQCGTNVSQRRMGAC